MSVRTRYLKYEQSSHCEAPHFEMLLTICYTWIFCITKVLIRKRCLAYIKWQPNIDTICVTNRVRQIANHMHAWQGINKCLVEWADSNWHNSFSFLPSHGSIILLEAEPKVPDCKKCDRKGQNTANMANMQNKNLLSLCSIILLAAQHNCRGSRMCNIICNCDNIL